MNLEKLNNFISDICESYSLETPAVTSNNSPEEKAFEMLNIVSSNLKRIKYPRDEDKRNLLNKNIKKIENKKIKLRFSMLGSSIWRFLKNPLNLNSKDTVVPIKLEFPLEPSKHNPETDSETSSETYDLSLSPSIKSEDIDFSFENEPEITPHSSPKQEKSAQYSKISRIIKQSEKEGISTFDFEKTEDPLFLVSSLKKKTPPTNVLVKKATNEISEIEYEYLDSNEFRLPTFAEEDFLLEDALNYKSLDKVSIREHLRIATKQGDPSATRVYAMMLYHGEGGKKNKKEALKYFKIAADLGDPPAQRIYAMICQKNPKKNALIKYFKYFKEAAKQNDSIAQIAHAIISYHVLNEPADKIEARKYFKEAADKGNHTAQRIYAMMCYYGEGGNNDMTEALKYLGLAANGKNGDRLAQRKLGMILYNGEHGVTKNHKEARKHFVNAKVQGDHPSAGMLKKLPIQIDKKFWNIDFKNDSEF
jgi:TPR repeat protein